MKQQEIKNNNHTYIQAENQEPDRLEFKNKIYKLNDPKIPA